MTARNVRPAVSAAVLTIWLCAAAAAAAQSVTLTMFDPLVITPARVEPVRYEAAISGRPTRVAFEFSPGLFRTGAPELEMRDDGTAGDRRAGDGIYTILLLPVDVIRVLQLDDVQRVFVGFLNIYNGTQRVQRANVFIDVYTSGVGPTPISRISGEMQSTSRLVNIHDPAFFVDFNVARIAQRFYGAFGDDFEFLNVISTPTRLLNRDHVVVKNDVDGIGLSRRDGSAAYGSGGRLLGVSRFPVPVFFDGASTGYVHELGHQWINYLNVAPVNSALPHWPFSSMASGVMGWSTPGGQGLSFPCRVVVDNGTVRLLPRAGEPVFNDFDLYLMGVIGADEVQDQFVFADQSGAQRVSCTGQIYGGVLDRVRIQSVIDRLGPRRPDARDAPKWFRTATILVSRDGLVSQEAMWLYSWLAARAELRASAPIHEGFLKASSNPFFVATRGRARLGTIIGRGAPDFEIAIAPTSVTVAAGSTATVRVAVMPTRRSLDTPVGLACSQLPDYVSCTFSEMEAVPRSAWAEVTLTIGTGGTSTEPATTPPGRHSLVIAGTSGDITHTAAVLLTVE